MPEPVWSGEIRVAENRGRCKTLARRKALYRAGRPPLALAGCTVILVDDGLATGATMRAAVQATRLHAAARIVVAVPVAAQASCAALCAEVDAVVCTMAPERFYAVGEWYDDFEATGDDEVLALLAAAADALSAGRA